MRNTINGHYSAEDVILTTSYLEGNNRTPQFYVVQIGDVHLFVQRRDWLTFKQRLGKSVRNPIEEDNGKTATEGQTR